MFFVLSKTLGFLVRPFNLILILFILSCFIKNSRWKKRFRWVSLAMFLIFSNGLVLDGCLLLWEKPAIAINDLGDGYDLAVVLGGTTDVGRKPDDRLFFQRGAGRVTHALNLYHAGKVKKILFTGGNARLFEDSRRDNSPIFKFYAMCGVAPEDILIESASRNTRENALFVKQLLDERGESGRVILITSAYHMRRSEGCFRKVGIDVTGFSADFYSALPKNRFDLERILPNPYALSTWNLLMKEWVGYLVYRLMGYL